MKKLLDIVKEKFDQADVYYTAQESSSVSIENGKLDEIETSKDGGYSIRTYKDGKTGFAYCNKIENPEQILESLEVSLAGAVEEDVELPEPVQLPKLNTYDENIKDVNSATLNETCERIYRYIKNKVDTEISIYGWKGVYESRLMNSKGIDYNEKGSYSGLYASMSYPGGAGSISTSFESKGLPNYSEKKLDELASLYKAGEKIVKPEGGKMKVLFMPSTVFSLIWRLSAAASANAVDQGTSVLKDKIGEKIFSDKISIYNNPLNDERPEASAFDGEGVVNKKRFIVENGVFK